MNQKILIIEDDANILYSLEAKFSVEGFKVTSLSDGALNEIIDKIRSCRPDYIIMDLILPQVHGHEILAAIKADESISSIPIFVFSDLSDADSRTRGLSLGAERYFIKEEFSIDDFVAKVKKIISNKEKIKK